MGFMVYSFGLGVFRVWAPRARVQGSAFNSKIKPESDLVVTLLNPT